MAVTFTILDNFAEVEAKVAYNNKWMDIFRETLIELGLSPFPSNGNYMLINGTMTSKTNSEILEPAMKQNIKEIHEKTGYFWCGRGK